MKVKCAFCGKMVEEEDVKFRLTVGGETLSFCSLDCLYKSEPIEEFRHISLSSLVLNKTVFEFLAIVTGLGGVYYTLFEAGSNALMMDTISVMAAIAAMIVGVEHLRYVEEHRLVGRAVLLLGAIILLSILLFVWLHGFS
jgi:YHS domain-containing protein